MAVPSSGELSLGSILAELNEDEYYLNPDGYSPSLQGLSTGGSPLNEAINTGNPSVNRPDGNPPHAMSEFYSYDHDSTATYWGAHNGAAAIADFTFNASSGTPSVSGMKTITLTNGSGTTDVYCSTNISGDKGAASVEMSVSNSGDPGTGGTGNSASGFNNYISSDTYSFASQSGSRTYYIRFKYQTGDAGTIGAAIYFANNSNTDDTAMTVSIS